MALMMTLAIVALFALMLLMPCLAALRNNSTREEIERPLQVQGELEVPQSSVSPPIVPQTIVPQPISDKLDSGSMPAPQRPRPMTSFEARLEEDFASDPNVRRPGKSRTSTERSGALLDDRRSALALAQVFMREHPRVGRSAGILPPIVADLAGYDHPERSTRNRLECAELDALRAHAVAMRAQAEDLGAAARVALAKAQLASDEAALVERTAAQAGQDVKQAA